MDVRIQAIHFDVAEKLVDFINKKADRLARHHSALTTADVTLKVVKPETAMNKEAGIKLVVPQHDDQFACKTADTIEEAVDLACDALKKQLEKTKKDK